MSDVRFAAADANLIASLRAPARWQGAAAEARDDGGLLLVAGARRFPAGIANCAVRLDRRLAAREALATAAAYFAARDRGFSWYLREPVDADLIDATAALPTVATMPWMTCEAIADAAPPPGVTLRWGDAGAAAAICADAYQSLGLPAAITASVFGAPPRAEAETPVVVAYDGAAALATARLVPSDGVAGVYWVATRPAARGRGLAELCTRAVTAAGLAAGAGFAALQASAMGERIYARLGFVERWRCRWVMVSREAARALTGSGG